MTVAALFVSPDGPYPELLGPELCWGIERDAMTYGGSHPVVAHPPCNLWVNLAASNWKRGLNEGKPRPYPAWYEGGSDGGLFAHALACVRKYGGVLEHPAGSWAWKHHGLRKPFNLIRLDSSRVGHWASGSWSTEADLLAGIEHNYSVCEVQQSAYGHKAQKKTWLLYCGQRSPFELDWREVEGTHQIGWFDRKKPTLSKKEAIKTPPRFARELIRLAEWSQHGK